MKCLRCGTINDDTSKYCIKCGSPMTGQVSQENIENTYNNQRPANTVNREYNSFNNSFNNPTISNYNRNFDYTPIGMWGYFGYKLLFLIPIVGFILLIVFSFGGTNNINLRNFARSHFCFLLIVIAILALALLITGGLLLSTSYLWSDYMITIKLSKPVDNFQKYAIILLNW